MNNPYKEKFEQLVKAIKDNTETIEVEPNTGHHELIPMVRLQYISEEMEIITNARPTVDDCPKCGNPIKMYWCDNCESNQDHTGECDNCGHAGGITYVVVEDKDYHLNCNKYMPFKPLYWCRLRGRGDQSCKIQTYNRHAICSYHEAHLQQITNDLEYIRELELVSPIINKLKEEV